MTGSFPSAFCFSSSPHESPCLSTFFSNQERFYFGDDVLPCFETGIPLLLNRLRQLPDAENVRIYLASIAHLSFICLFFVLYFSFYFNAR
jgi:hypothetical protein